MSRAQMARLFISQRLSAAAEDIFRLFEEIITEYEEQIYLQKKTPDASMDTEPTDHLQLPDCKEEVPPEQQERNPILILGGEPKTQRIKEEQDDAGLEEHDSYAEILASTELQAAREEEENAATLSGTLLYSIADVRFLNSDDTDTGAENQSFSLEETTQPHSVSHTLNPGHVKGVQTWASRNDYQRPTEPAHELESSHYVQSHLCCKVCRKSFFNKRSLIYHVRAHPRDCGLCGKHLDSRESLDAHLQAHKKCAVCGKKFNSITHLERHMRTHTGERPFSCPVCGKCFTQKDTMTKHIFTHTGVKPFGCLLCGKVFGKKQNLERHVRIHTGEKRYSCSSCGKRFTQLVHLNTHKCRM